MTDPATLLIALFCLPPHRRRADRPLFRRKRTSLLATWGSTILLSTIVGAAAMSAIEWSASTPQFKGIFGDSPPSTLSACAAGAALGAFAGCVMGLFTAGVLLGERLFRS